MPLKFCSCTTKTKRKEKREKKIKWEINKKKERESNLFKINKKTFCEYTFHFGTMT